VFHHAVVVVMAYLWLAEAQSLQQIALLTNTFVHVVMYYYYFLCTLKIYPWWKRYITTLQIVQFIFRQALLFPWRASVITSASSTCWCASETSDRHPLSTIRTRADGWCGHVTVS
jgi:GNS1/SUR4 family